MTLLPMTGYNPEKPWLTEGNDPFQIPSGAANQAIPPQTPFIWGQGGARLTPEQILARQEYAQRQMQSDFSPVGSIWEGLGRVANNVTGALDARSLDRQQQENAAESDALLQAVLGGNTDAVTAALTSPYASPEVLQFAKMQWDRQNPKPRAPFEFEGLLAASGFTPGTPEYTAKANELLLTRTDPFTNISLQDGRQIFGPQSLVQQSLSQAQPAQPGAQPPQTLPPDFDFGGPTQPASGGFRPGG